MSETTLLNLRDYLFGTLTESNMLWLAKQLLEHVKAEEKPLKPLRSQRLTCGKQDLNLQVRTYT